MMRVVFGLGQLGQAPVSTTPRHTALQVAAYDLMSHGDWHLSLPACTIYIYMSPHKARPGAGVTADPRGFDVRGRRDPLFRSAIDGPLRTCER